MDQNESDKAIQSLSVYRDRGLEVLNALDDVIAALSTKNIKTLDECLAKVEELLRWRDAAFHNFRALDFIALDKKLDIADCKVSKEIGEQNVQIEMQIESKIRRITEHRNEIINKFTNSRKAIGRYRSGIKNSKKIQANV